MELLLMVFGMFVFGAMLNLRSPLRDCHTKRFTAGADITVVTAGDPAVIRPVIQTVGEVSGFVLENVLSGATGIFVYKTGPQGYVSPKATGVIGDGVRVFWDPNGNPIVGVAGTGACVAMFNPSYFWLVYAVGDAGIDTKTVTILDPRMQR